MRESALEGKRQFWRQCSLMRRGETCWIRSAGFIAVALNRAGRVQVQAVRGHPCTQRLFCLLVPRLLASN